MESDATKLADATASRDPETGLAAVAALRRLLESLEELQVENARAQGWPWERIAAALGVSKQAAHKKHGGRSLLPEARLMFERFAEPARQAVVAAQDESRALGHRRIGTEHLLLGLAREEDTLVAHLLRGAGLEAERLRGAVIETIGRGGSDADALASIGIDLDTVRRAVESAFGSGALERTRHGCVPFTPPAKRSLELAVREARGLGHGHIESFHLLLGLARSEGVARGLLEAHGLGYERLHALVVDALAA